MGARHRSSTVRFRPKRSLAKLGLGESRLDDFLSGCRILFSFGDVVVYEPSSHDAEIREVWSSVGNFIGDAMQEAVEADRSLPELPKDLFSPPDSGVLARDDERLSAASGLPFLSHSPR